MGYSCQFTIDVFRTICDRFGVKAFDIKQDPANTFTTMAG